MITSAEFARRIGVSRAAVAKAIKVGRVPIYDEAGSRVAPPYGGRFFVDPDEAAAAFRLSRARIDDAALAEAALALDREIEADLPPPLAPRKPAAAALEPPGPPPPAPPIPDLDETAAVSGSLVAARTDSELLKQDLLRLRRDKERGELISRPAVAAALEAAGTTAARHVIALRSRAEELTAAAHTGGAHAVAALLVRIADDILVQVTDAIAKAIEDAA